MRRSESRVTYGSMPSSDEVVEQPAHQLLHAEREAQGVEAWARCSCRRWRGCPRRCGASGRCSPWPRRGRRVRTMALSSSSTVQGRVEQAVARAPCGGPTASIASARSKRRRARGVKLQMAGHGGAHVVRRQRVLLGEQLVGAHQQGHAPAFETGIGLTGGGAVRGQRRQMRLQLGRGHGQQAVQELFGGRRCAAPRRAPYPARGRGRQRPRPRRQGGAAAPRARRAGPRPSAAHLVLAPACWPTGTPPDPPSAARASRPARRG